MKTKCGRERTTNKKASGFVANHEGFVANNLDGLWVNNQWYVVFSYGWYPIFAYNKEANYWLENENGYTMSTKKQMTKVRPYSSLIRKADLKNYRPWAEVAGRWL